MNNYILFDKILKCSVVDDSSRYSLIFKKWKRKYKFCNKYENFVQERNRSKTQEETKERIKLLLEKEEQKRKKLEELGIKFDFPGFVI
jgi:nucleolar protein 15